MAAFNKINDFLHQTWKGVHDLDGTHTIKVALTNTAPTAGQTNWNVTDHPPPAAANGYPTGGAAAAPTLSQAAGVTKLTLVDVVFTATAGGIGPFRYAIVYNDTPTTPLADPAMSWYDYGSEVTLADGETFTVDFDDANGWATNA